MSGVFHYNAHYHSLHPIHGNPNRGPSRCIMRLATSFLNYVYGKRELDYIVEELDYIFCDYFICVYLVLCLF
jgi:hypothetical protein